MAELKTPLKKVRGLGSAKEGAEHFWQQRMTAMANVPLTLFFVISIAALYGADHADVVAYLSNPIVAILLLLMVVSATFHMRLGMQVIIEDYIHAEGMKVILLMANTFFAVFVALACAYALLRIGIS